VCLARLQRVKHRAAVDDSTPQRIYDQRLWPIGVCEGLGKKGDGVMCGNCENEALGRRDVLKFGTAGIAALGLGVISLRAHAAEGTASSLSPGEALLALKSGNERYVSHPELCSIDIAEQRSAVAAHQAPWATIVSCADSRVPPELIFGGHGVGELFVARNAGNLVDTATLGTVEYGAAVLGSPLIVVLAHTSCGAVKAACDVVTKNATYPGAIGPMIEPILPAALAVRSAAGDFVNNAAKESAKRTAGRLTTASTLIADLTSAGKLKIAAAIYDLKTGVVTYLD
jgi:carbonic anhydrase